MIAINRFAKNGHPARRPHPRPSLRCPQGSRHEETRSARHPRQCCATAPVSSHTHTQKNNTHKNHTKHTHRGVRSLLLFCLEFLKIPNSEEFNRKIWPVLVAIKNYVTTIERYQRRHPSPPPLSSLSLQ
jgi:hypothetical protein